MLLPSLVLAFGSLQGPSVPLAPAAGLPPKLAVQAIRFYAPQAGETLVLAFVQVPYVLAEAAGGRIAWQTRLQVLDAAGVQQYEESWWAGAPASFRVPEAYGIEALRFRPVGTGRYTIRVTVQDSVSGRTASTETVVTAFSEQPAVSDLLLASDMRVTAPGDTTSLPGEIARGTLRFITAPDLTLDALTPQLAFMLEAYTTAEASATTRLEIRRRAGGTVIYRLAPFEQTIPAGGGVIRGQFPLEGLPEGEYDLVATVNLGSRSVERTAGFAVGSLEAAMARSLASRTARRGLDEAYFGSLSEEELDAAADVLAVIAKPAELAVYQASGDGALTVSAKRQFLVQFWAERDLDRTTPVNETRLAFYDAIDYANQLFGESGRNARPGWKSPRGRIFVKYGRPDERTPFPAGNRSPAFEIWRYTQGRLRYFVFVDENNFGNFRLIKTNDLQETSAPNWCEILTPQAVTEYVEPYLGQRFLVASGISPDGSGGSGQILCN